MSNNRKSSILFWASDHTVTFFSHLFSADNVTYLILYGQSLNVTYHSLGASAFLVSYNGANCFEESLKYFLVNFVYAIHFYRKFLRIAGIESFLHPANLV